MKEATPEGAVPRWSAPKAATYVETLIKPRPGQRVWGVGIGVEQGRAEAQNIEIVAAGRDDVLLCEPSVACRWHIVRALTTIVCAHERFEGPRAWAHCVATGGHVEAIEVRVIIANAQGNVYTEQWSAPWALVTQGDGTEPDEIRIAWTGDTPPNPNDVQDAVGGVLLHGGTPNDGGWMAHLAKQQARVIAVRDTAGVERARELAITCAVQHTLRTFALQCERAGERVQVDLHGPAPNQIETMVEHDVGALEARHPWWHLDGPGWCAEAWSGSSEAGEIGVAAGPAGVIAATQKRSVPAQSRHETDISGALGLLIENRTLEEPIAQGLAQALVGPANERWPKGWKIPTGHLRYWLGLVRVRERRAPTWIAAAAVGDQRSVVVTLPPPARHFEVTAAAARHHSDNEIRKWGHRGQGFVDQHRRWLSRAAAEEVARASGQLRGATIGGILTSEDLW